MIELVKRLEEKWGPFDRATHYMEQCKLPFISNQAVLNVLFDPVKSATIEETFDTKLKSSLLPELKDFYASFNGCRLFSNSFNIYGIQLHAEDVYEPYDIIIENNNNYAKMDKAEKCNLLFFGSLGGDYIFGYDRDERSRIYCVEAGHAKVLRQFNSFEEFMQYHINWLIEEYDEKGKKITPEEDTAGIPILENLTSQLF